MLFSTVQVQKKKEQNLLETDSFTTINGKKTGRTSLSVLVIDKQSGVGASKLSISKGMDEVISKEMALHGPIAGSSITSKHFSNSDKDSS